MLSPPGPQHNNTDQLTLIVANMLHSVFHCIDWTIEPSLADSGWLETPVAVDDVTGRNRIRVRKRSEFLSTKASRREVEWPV